MLSDERVLAALRAVRGSIDAYRAAVGVAAERIESYLAMTADDPTHAREMERLGQFASDRIDIERFAALWGERAALDEFERALLARARDLLREAQHAADARFVHDVPTGGRLNLALGNTFAELGRPFGATLVAELVRSGRYDPAEHTVLLHGLPRHRWNRAERAVAPPVILTLDGADLWAGEAAQYVDGNQKMVLIVRTPAPPAALVRLVTPDTLVVQTTSVERMASSLAHPGPGVVALMPEGAAEFAHVPDARLPLHQRITIAAPPQGARKALPSWTAWHQDQDWQQLLAMSLAPSAAVSGMNGGGAPGGGGGDDVDRLAGWLLAQAQLTPAQG